MVRILHLVYDEKFIDFIAGLFAGCDGTENRYRVIADDASAPLTRVGDLGDMRVVDVGYANTPACAADLAWCDALVVHYLGLTGARAIVRAPDRVRVAWSGWGGDYYDLLTGDANDLVGPSTRWLVDAIRPASGARSLAARLQDALRPMRRRFVVEPLLRRAIARVDIFSAPVPADADVLVRAGFPLARAEYAQLNYVSLERSLVPGLREVSGEDLLVGNSASWTNNHADVFDQLSTLELGARRVIVPLSYGDRAYRDAVIAYGRRVLGDRLEPLVDFLPLPRYNELISQCSLAIMGHRRQEAVGNIAALLQAGARVFVDRASPVYHDLVARGAILSALDELGRDGAAALVPLTPAERAANRAVVASVWGHAVVQGNTCRFVERLARRSA